MYTGYILTVRIFFLFWILDCYWKTISSPTEEQRIFKEEKQLFGDK